MTLINADNTLSLLAVIIIVVAAGFFCEKTELGRKISAPLIILIAGLALGNLGVIPNSAALYDNIQNLLVPMAIPLLLFRANLAKVFKESGRMLLAFFLATMVTIIGALVSAACVDMGALEPKIVGVLTASYIGGSANFVATSQAVQFSDSSLYTSALAADAIGAVFFLILLMSLPALSVVNRLLPSQYIGKKSKTEHSPTEQKIDASAQELMAGIVNAVALSLVICVTGNYIAQLVPVAGSFIMTITVLSLMLANLGRKIIDKIHFDFEIGTILMYIFFATVGAGANILNVFGLALPILCFLMILIVVHITLLILFGSWLKLDLAELVVASSACILGPAAAAAIAAGQGWRSLVSPGMLVGVLGYAIATFIGIALAGFL